VNVLGHTYVAAARAPTEDLPFLFGAVLPDLAGMARIRLDRAARDGPFGDGIRCHHQVDLAFHADRAFQHGAVALRADLEASGLARGPARAIGHAGWELLLDGALLGSATEASYRRALVHAPEAVGAVVAPSRERWTAWVERWMPPPPMHYDDAEWVARRLYSMLADRPRLGFAPADIPTVTAALHRHADTVRSAAPGILARSITASAA
jgi:hypothetical protein